MVKFKPSSEKSKIMTGNRTDVAQVQKFQYMKKNGNRSSQEQKKDYSFKVDKKEFEQLEGNFQDRKMHFSPEQILKDLQEDFKAMMGNDKMKGKLFQSMLAFQVAMSTMPQKAMA